MESVSLPFVIYETERKMNDYRSDDMCFGDLTEKQLKENFQLWNISERVDPYKLEEKSSFNRPQSPFCCNSLIKTNSLFRKACADIMFNEMRSLSHAFSFLGTYKNIINKMLNHMQYGTGKPFTDGLLDMALKEQISYDNSDSGSLRRIKRGLIKSIDWDKNYLPKNKTEEITTLISKGRLPKFDTWHDNINGMGVSVHDTWATKIILRDLTVSNNSFRAQIHYNVQDHFGLDKNDIRKQKFFQFQFFRLWFLLQHHHQFAFRPFMTNMEAEIFISGSKYDI
ncbi:DUF3289 family protein [Siccibacter colletis]|uniref:DUF3289 family protein n=1 Tax=Siccibacter colletis TaxID=1505757 RepID=A0ABY6JEC3_9ENTR|nr:DUF3289 family protein [Siccibacter colletis]UYU31982.1 DUF3289 family protein [Siccibacter colletis]